MPRFHFNIYDGNTVLDRIGTEFDNFNDARVEAVGVAGRIILENSDHVCTCQEWRLEITDEKGLVLIWLEFHAVESPAIQKLHLINQKQN